MVFVLDKLAIITNVRSKKNAEHAHLETTDKITAIEAQQMLEGKGFYAQEVAKRLALHHIPLEQLHVFGSLTTDRVEIPYKEGLLVFDHSFYLQCDDYEVEYEAKDAIKGNIIFDGFYNNMVLISNQLIKNRPFYESTKSTKFIKVYKGRCLTPWIFNH